MSLYQFEFINLILIKYVVYVTKTFKVHMSNVKLYHLMNMLFKIFWLIVKTFYHNNYVDKRIMLLIFFYFLFWFRSLSTFYFQTLRNYTIYTKTYTEILFHRSSFKRTWPKGQVNFSYHFIHLKTSSHLIDFIIKLQYKKK